MLTESRRIRATAAAALTAIAALSILATSAMAQLDSVDPPPPETTRPISQRLNDIFTDAHIEHATARQAFDWWANTSGIPLLIDWEAMERDGVNPQTPVNIRLRDVPADQLLSLIAQQASPDEPLIIERAPWYVRVQTKRQAMGQLVTRVYFLGDLTHPYAPRVDPPRLDLQSALPDYDRRRGTTAQELFGPRQAEVIVLPDPAEQIIQIITETVEPEIWARHGGPATIRHYQGRLVVRAPLYIHQQLGLPEVATTAATPRLADPPSPTGDPFKPPYHTTYVGRPSVISGTNVSATPIAGVNRP